jgi:bla regulator protein blaR1
MIGELTNHLWQSTMFSVLAGLMAVAFRKNRAQVRYWLWLSASFKFLIPFSLLMSLGSHLQWAPAAQGIAAPAVSFTMVQIAQPFPRALPVAPPTQGSSDWAPMAMLGVWACGFGTIVLIRFRDWLLIRAAVRSSAPIDLPATIEVRSSPGLLEPGVVGWWRSTLLLPAGITEHLAPHQLEAVLAHELCHARRHDNLTSAIHMIVEAVFWFHPLVWWIGARLVEARERACDEAVLSFGSEPRDYAEGILNVCKSYLKSPLRCVSGVSGSDLKKRIHAIMTGRVAGELTFARKIALATVGITALAAPIVVGMMNAPAVRAQWPKLDHSVQPFETASIKVSTPTGSGLRGPFWTVNPPRLDVKDSPLRALIQAAYGVREFQISGGPSWINSDRYDIHTKAQDMPLRHWEQVIGPMLQLLLEGRFKLKVRRETKELPVYTLTVAKSGLKLRRSNDRSCTPFDWNNIPSEQDAQLSHYCGVVENGLNAYLNHTWDGVGISMTGVPGRADAAGLTTLLSSQLDRLVIDKTGLTGLFDLHLEWNNQATVEVLAREGSRDPNIFDSSDDSSSPSIFAAVHEQLGLMLEADRGPVEILVIDHVEKPSEN